MSVVQKVPNLKGYKYSLRCLAGYLAHSRCFENFLLPFLLLLGSFPLFLSSWVSELSEPDLSVLASYNLVCLGNSGERQCGCAITRLIVMAVIWGKIPVHPNLDTSLLTSLKPYFMSVVCKPCQRKQRNLEVSGLNLNQNTYPNCELGYSQYNSTLPDFIENFYSFKGPGSENH